MVAGGITLLGVMTILPRRRWSCRFTASCSSSRTHAHAGTLKHVRWRIFASYAFCRRVPRRCGNLVGLPIGAARPFIGLFIVLFRPTAAQPRLRNIPLWGYK